MDDRQVYWFKRRRYGWGWTPVTWQGWVTILSFLLLVAVIAAIFVDDEPRNTITQDGILFVASVVILSLCLMMISLAKGPAPKWRWGQTAADNPDEDF